jgi:UDP-N-acetylmuramoyl-L-alanyl-D-glutamate--2,6-diaminopimelate ligase
MRAPDLSAAQEKFLQMKGRYMIARELTERLDFRLLKGDLSAEVAGLSFDNRTVGPGDAFVCIKGAYFDTHDVIDSIAAAGPSVIVVDEKRAGTLDLADVDTSVIAVSDTRAAKAAVCAAYYGYPADKLTVIGITGSKGKTTSAAMLLETLKRAGLMAGAIGSNGVIIGDDEFEVGTTTPDSDEIQKYLAMMVERGFKYAVIEASSQGLMQHRVDMIDFAAGIFLNIEEGDHVGTNEHPTFENYMHCKGLLLKKSRLAVINSDDPHIDALMEDIDTPFVTFGHASDDGGHRDRAGSKINGGPDYVISGITPSDRGGDPGESFRIDGKINGDYFVKMPGSFNAMNAAAVIAASNELGIDPKAAEEALADIHVAGRIDMVYRSPELSVCIDSAHNGLSTRSLLTALRAYKPKRLVCVFGCGGNRDVDRRREMGEASGKLADYTIITTEHNRFEKFEDILSGIREGIDPTGGKYRVIEDRKEAIRTAITESEPGDLIAIIGLGHDKYQHVLGKNVPHDDTACALAAVEEWKEKH